MADGRTKEVTIILHEHATLTGDARAPINSRKKRYVRFLETSFAEWREVLGVDLDSVFLMTRAAAPHIVSAGGGSIVCLGGSPSHMGTRGRSHVCAAKMGVVACNRDARPLEIYCSPQVMSE